MPATELAIETVGKGAVPQPHDPRDFQASFVMGAPLVDWTHEFRLPQPPNEDQGTSLSCVSQAWSYFHHQLVPYNWSRRDVYSQIFLPQGGAYLRSGGVIITGPGQATRDKAPDPHPETESEMRSRDGISAEMERIGQEAGYFSVNAKDIGVVAAAIRDFKGCIIGVQGDNAGWKDLLNPKPPVNAEWGHALYCFGFHMHGAFKCIIAKSSWCNTGITEHHIKENYFESGNTFDGWTLIPKERIPMVRRFIINDHGTLGVLLITDGSFDQVAHMAKNQAMLAQLKALYEVPDNAPVINVP